MKLLIVSCLIALALANDDNYGQIIPTEETIEAYIEKFGQAALERMQPKAAQAPKGLNPKFGPQQPPNQVQPVPPCDQDAWVQANRDLYDKLGLPKVVLGYKVLQTVKALVIADGYDGVVNLAIYIVQYGIQLGDNVYCFHPYNLRALGLPYAAILPTILRTAQLATDSVNVLLLADGGYSCSVKTALDTKSEEIALVKLAAALAAQNTDDICSVVRQYLFAMTAIFASECGQNVGLYVYYHEAAPLKILHSQCNFPGDKNNDETIKKFLF